MRQAQESKRSGVSATDLHSKLFFKARVRLTVVYVSIIAVIAIGFSIFLYQSTSANLAELFEVDEKEQTQKQVDAFEEALERLQATLIFSDIFIILVSGGVGYFLARVTLRPVEESHEAQRLFAANASHELRTPLAIMKNDIEVLLRDSNPERTQVQKTFSSNLEEIEIMTSLIQDLLILARSGQAQNHHDRSQVYSVITQVIEKMLPIAREKDIALSSEGDLVSAARISEAMLSRVIMGVIENSLKYTSSGGSVTVHTIKESTHVRIDVADTGEGIPPGELPHIFERFYRGASNSSDTGTGLGLAIVKESVELGNGTVTVRSELGKGTTVSITFPLA